jgi:hypothetical protein
MSIEAMNESSQSVHERSRRAFQVVLQRITTNGKQTAVATAMGTSDSTISRLVSSKDLERSIQLIHHLGLKVVEEDMVMVDFQELQTLKRRYAQIAEYEQRTGRIFGDEENFAYTRLSVLSCPTGVKKVIYKFCIRLQAWLRAND